MLDPVTAGAMITGIVGAYKAYTEYKAATAKAAEQGEAAPAKSAEAAQGEAAAEVVTAVVQQHGTEDERADLASFARNPQRYAAALTQVLQDIAAREPAAAQHLQTLAQQANIQTGGVQGTVNVSGGKVYGPVAGVNTGEMNPTYTFGPDDDDEDEKA